MQQWWDDDKQRKTEELGGNPATVTIDTLRVSL
jgi:hypothetical protein